jgi:spore coat polysaccharide biosynthesis protein SpsF (cytidylyltransferase family)
MMPTRDQYVESLKKQLDAWNAEIARWETKTNAARDEMKKRYRDQLATLDARREKARYTLKLIEGASAAAWGDLRWGVDEAWDRMHDAMKEARSHFERAQPPRSVEARTAPRY